MVSPKKAQIWLILIMLTVLSADSAAQRKRTRKTVPAPQNELVRLREEFVKATNEYKASLEKLLAIYEGNVKKAEAKVETSKKLLAEGLIAKAQVEENELA